jgi:small subunit ribosomal protein S6e
MASFKFVLSNGQRSAQLEKDQKDSPIIGKKIGDSLDGGFLGLDGYELKITGGHDKNGFPMMKDIDGLGKRAVVLSRGTGFAARMRKKKKLHDAKEGLRKRKTVRGNTISAEISQINCKIIKSGEKSFDEIFPPKQKEEKKD